MKTVLITGATSGIGYETAKVFAKNNYKVIAIGRNVDGLIKLKNEIGDHVFIRFDLQKTEQVPDLYQQIHKKIKHVDILINNAGIGLFKKFEDASMKDWHNVFMTNLFAPVALTKVYFEDMKKQGGIIVNVASVAGKRTWKELTAYSASKHALMGFSNSLRRECKYHKYPINIITILPPSVNTPFFEREGYLEYKKNHPLVWMLSPEQVAKEIFSAVKQKKREVIIGRRAKVFDKVNALMPHTLENFEEYIQNRIKKK